MPCFTLTASISPLALERFPACQRNGTQRLASDCPVAFYNCDNGATNYHLYTKTFMGSTQQDTTTVCNGGASSGTTPVSWKMMSSANAYYGIPLQSQEIAIWNTSTGSSITATVEIAGSAALNTTDIWVEFEYPTSSGSPLGGNATTKATILATGTAVTSSSATWSGSPASKQKLTASFTPNMAGIIKARVYLAKPSTTVYIDPMITLSNGVANRRQYILPGYGSVNETAQGEFSAPFVS